MNLCHNIPAGLIGAIATIFIAQPTAIFAISDREVAKIAKSNAVSLDSQNQGSRVIIKQEDNTYRAIAAREDWGVQVSSTPKAEDFYLQGLDKLQKKDYRGAIADFDRAIELNPNYVEAYSLRGIARSQLGDNQGQIADFTAILRINPNYVAAYLFRGLARSQLGDNRGAIEDFTPILRIDPNLDIAYFRRGLPVINWETSLVRSKISPQLCESNLTMQMPTTVGEMSVMN